MKATVMEPVSSLQYPRILLMSVADGVSAEHNRQVQGSSIASHWSDDPRLDERIEVMPSFPLREVSFLLGAFLRLPRLLYLGGDMGVAALISTASNS